MDIKDPRVLVIRNQKVLSLNTFITTQARVGSISLSITGAYEAQAIYTSHLTYNGADPFQAVHRGREGRLLGPGITAMVFFT